jgi:hypothetical protein
VTPIVWYKFTDVSEEPAAPKFKVESETEQATGNILLYTDDENNLSFRNMRELLPEWKASHFRSCLWH